MSFLCPCEAVDKIFPVVKVKTEVETGRFHVIFSQVVHLLQFAQIPDTGFRSPGTPVLPFDCNRMSC